MAPPPNLRIICLSPGAADSLFALGLPSCLVGRPQNCCSPPSVFALPCVTSNATGRQSCPSLAPDDKTLRRSLARFSVNWELVKELEPDLIIVQDQTEDDGATALRPPREAYWSTTKKCRIVFLESHTIEDVFRNLQFIADCCGVHKDGVKLVNDTRSRLKLVKQTTPQWADGMPWVSVACLSSVNPLTEAGYWITEIVSCAGGSSPSGSSGCAGNPLTLGDLLRKDPDVIVFLCHGFSTESIARELSWLKHDKTWRQLRAVKANRFFVANADRFFLDSGPNVPSSTEMMVEILHGFGHGYEGDGFLRWHDHPSADGVDVCENSIQKHPSSDECSKEMPGSLSGGIAECKGLNSKQSSHDNDETLTDSLIVQIPAQDDPKYVTDVYEKKRNVSAEPNPQDWYPSKSRLDPFNAPESEHNDIVEDRLYSQELGDMEVEKQRCLNAMNSRLMTPTVNEATSSAHEFMVWDEPREKWQKPTKETFLHKPAGSGLVKSKSLFSQNQRGESVPAQTLKHPKADLADANELLTQPSLKGQVHSTLITNKRLQKGSLEQEVISKVWAYTYSAAKARSDMASNLKDRVLNKSRTVAVCSGTLACENSTFPSKNRSAAVQKSKTLPRQVVAPLISSHDYNVSKRDVSSAESNEIISRNSSGKLVEDAHRPKSRQISWVDRSLGSSGLDVSFTKKNGHSNLVNSAMKGGWSDPAIVRDLVLESLAEIQYADCLLLSGGLASSILAEAAPLVQSGGFRLGITVSAGPEATDRAFAEDVVKRLGMQHVIIGDREKGNAVALLARELSFVVKTLKTFDPLQIRNCVPIAAALREAKSQGCSAVLTGDYADVLFSGDCSVSTSLHDGHLPLWGLTKVYRCAAVLLGQALGVKVLQPFLHPKIVKHFNTLHPTDLRDLDDVDMGAVGSRTGLSMRSFLRRAFPKVAAACRKKDFIEAGSGLYTVSEYFSTAISASIVQSKAKHIKRKDGVCIRDAEHLIYYREFKRVFKDKLPPGMMKGGTNPCVGCGYQLSIDMDWHCLVCGHNLQRIGEHIKEDKMKYSNEVTSPVGSADDVEKNHVYGSKVKFEMAEPVSRRDVGREVNVFRELAYPVPKSGQATNDSIKLEKRQSVHNKKYYVQGIESTSGSCKIADEVSTCSGGSQDATNKRQGVTRPKYFLALGAGSAALLLLLQLSKT